MSIVRSVEIMTMSPILRKINFIYFDSSQKDNIFAT